MSFTPLIVLATIIALAAPAAQAIWLPLNHLRFWLYHRRQGTLPSPLGLFGSLRYYWRALRSNLVLCGWFIRGLGQDGLRHPSGDATGPPVLCVHGYLRNGTCMWGLRGALERRGRPTRAVSMGRPFRTVENYMPPLEFALRQLVTAHPGERIDVVAHSMGGVVLRQVLAQHPDLATAVGKIITLGSPHRGTAAARGPITTPESRRLTPGSTFLAELPDFGASAPQAQVTTIAADLDFIVYPHSTSHLPGARTIDFPQSCHPGLITESEVIDCVVRTLLSGR